MNPANSGNPAPVATRSDVITCCLGHPEGKVYRPNQRLMTLTRPRGRWLTAQERCETCGKIVSIRLLSASNITMRFVFVCVFLGVFAVFFFALAVSLLFTSQESQSDTIAAAITVAAIGLIPLIPVILLLVFSKQLRANLAKPRTQLTFGEQFSIFMFGMLSPSLYRRKHGILAEDRSTIITR